MAYLKAIVTFAISLLAIYLFYDHVSIPIIPCVSLYPLGLLLRTDAARHLRKVFLVISFLLALFLYGLSIYRSIAFYPAHLSVIGIILEGVTIIAFITSFFFNWGALSQEPKSYQTHLEKSPEDIANNIRDSLTLAHPAIIDGPYVGIAETQEDFNMLSGAVMYFLMGHIRSKKTVRTIFNHLHRFIFLNFGSIQSTDFKMAMNAYNTVRTGVTRIRKLMNEKGESMDDASLLFASISSLIPRDYAHEPLLGRLTNFIEDEVFRDSFPRVLPSPNSNFMS